jgi:hypothetical protein
MILPKRECDMAPTEAIATEVSALLSKAGLVS